MSTPSVGLRLGANVDEAINELRALEANSRGALPAGAMHQVDEREAYVRWATRTEKGLLAYLERDGARSLFDSSRHHDICSMPAGTQLPSLINAELDDHSARFGKLAVELELSRDLFTKPGGVHVAPDTSFYIEHPEKVEEVDFRPLLTIREEPVRIVVPIIVVDELDGLKRSGDRHTRWRAGYTLAVIDRVVAHPPEPGCLHGEDFSALEHGGIPRGEVTLQIAFDPPGHERLAINDDEIVDRCLACQAFAGSLTVLTYDTGQSTRARSAGLPVKKLSQPVEQAPLNHPSASHS